MTNVTQEDSIEELLDLSRANAQALVIATANFLEQAGLPIEAWTGYLGELFARSWDDSMRGDAGAFLQAVLSNYKAFGAEVLRSNLSTNRAEALIANFPSQDLCAELGADCAVATAYYNVPAAVAAQLGLEWSWAIESDHTRLTVTRQT